MNRPLAAGDAPGRGDDRPGWDEYFMDLADVVARRSTCQRRAVGAVIARERRILATGYNGSPPGFPHCTEVGCLEVDGRCVRTIHAEMNAVVQAALHGVRIDGSSLYCTSFPCLNCTKVLIGGGVERVVYRDAYDDPLSWQFLETAGVTVQHLADHPMAAVSRLRGTRGAGG